MRPSQCWLPGLASILLAGCGAAAHGSNPIAAPDAVGIAAYAQVAEASCMTGEADGRSTEASCVFVLADGRRFSCPLRFAQSVQTARSLEGSNACRMIAPLHLSASVRRVTATIERMQACLTERRLRAIGNAALPALTDPSSPDGELIAGYLPSGAMIAFYRDVEKARRLEQPVLRNAQRIHAQVERHGAVTILWWRSPPPALRRGVEACLPVA